MAKNKLAVVRYHALDKCFSDFNRKYYIEDLEIAVEKALTAFNDGKKKEVSRKQIYEDIKFMKSEKVYSAPIEEFKEGKRVFRRYSSRSYSILNKGLTPVEIDMTQDLVLLLNSLSGFENMEWVKELMTRLKDITETDAPSVIGFQKNPYLAGIEYFDPLYQAIRNKRVLELTYKSFTKTDPVCYTFHPYYLKEYNNRWFVLGRSEGYDELSLFPLDRIESIKTIKKDYCYEEIDFDEYFDDVVGVSIKKDAQVENIKLLVHKDSWFYLKTKPLHHSQRNITELNNGDYYGMGLKVIINHELKANLLYRGSTIKVLEPESLVQWMKEETSRMSANYI